MTVLASIAAMIAAAASSFLFSGVGTLVLKVFKIQIESKLERLLFAPGAGVIVLAVLVSLGEVIDAKGVGVRIAIVSAAGLGILAIGHVGRACCAVCVV